MKKQAVKATSSGLVSVASYVFFVCVFLLLGISYVFRMVVQGDDLWSFILGFVMPLLAVYGIWMVDHNHRVFDRLVHDHLQKLRLLAVCVPLMAMGVSCVTYDPNSVDFGIIYMAALSMALTPYILNDVDRAGVSVLLQTLAFSILALSLGGNLAAVAIIILVAAAVLVTLPKLPYLMNTTKQDGAKVSVAVLTLFFAVPLLLLVERSGFIDALFLRIFESPDSSLQEFHNAQLQNALEDAKLWGPCVDRFFATDCFEHQVLTYIICRFGWLAAVPVLLVQVAMILSGAYLAYRNYRIHSYLTAAAMALIAVQTVAYDAMCLGWNLLWVPNVCPFLDGNWRINLLFLLPAIYLIPPVYEEVETEDEQEDYVELELLDPKSPTFHKDLDHTLAQMPICEENMYALWSFLRYSSTPHLRAWETLFMEYEDEMDEDFYQMALAYFRKVYRKEDLGRSFLKEYY